MVIVFEPEYESIADAIYPSITTRMPILFSAYTMLPVFLQRGFCLIMCRDILRVIT